jgi:hypothetical protein
MNVKLDVNVPDFVRHINEVKRESGRDSEEMLKYVMILMLQAGRTATKLGRKNRALVQQDNETENDQDAADAGILKGSGRVRFYLVYHQGSYVPKKVFVPSIPRKSKKNASAREEAIRARDAIVARFKRINYRGIAKASWGWAMKMISQTRALGEQADALANMARRNPIEVNKQITGLTPFIEVTNKLDWIRRLAPDIEQRMMNSADSRLQSWLERRWQTGIDRAERRTA